MVIATSGIEMRSIRDLDSGSFGPHTKGTKVHKDPQGRLGGTRSPSALLEQMRLRRHFNVELGDLDPPWCDYAGFLKNSRRNARSSKRYCRRKFSRFSCQ